MEVYNSKKKPVKLIKSYIINAIFVFIAIFNFIILIFSQKKFNLYYTEKSNLNYKVYLEENNYYETSYLEKDMQYIAALIDYINVNFDYSFKINEEIDYNYKYYVESHLVIFEKNKPNNIIFEKKNNLLDGTVTNENNSNQFNINENLKIDYREYNNLAKFFKSEYNILADSNLKITLYIEADGVQQKYEYPIKINTNMAITIPLTEQMINVHLEYEKDKAKDVLIDKGTNDSALLIFNIAFGIFTTISLIKLFISIYEFKKNQKSYYQKNMKKILDNYDRIIAKIEINSLTPNYAEFIDLISFEDLVYISDRVGEPILHIEIEENIESWFIVRHDKTLYRFMLKEIKQK